MRNPPFAAAVRSTHPTPGRLPDRKPSPLFPKETPDERHSRNVSFRFGLLLAAAWIATACRPVAVRAAAPVASLDIVPADAAFYSAMLRSREQFDALANSKAWEKVKALPFVQTGFTMYQMQAANPGSPAGWLQAALNNPESRKSLEFLADIFSEEVFVYGGPSFNKTIELYQMRSGPRSSRPLAP